MVKMTFSLCALVILCNAEPITYMSNSSTDIFKNPSSDSISIKTLKPGETISGTTEKKNGYIAIIGGYVKENDVTPIRMIEEKTKDGKSMKAMVENTFNTKEVPISYTGIVKADSVNLRTCPSLSCNSIGTKKNQDRISIQAKTIDGAWYKTNKSYISSSFVVLDQQGDISSIGTKENASELVKSKVTAIQPLPKIENQNGTQEQVVEVSEKVTPVAIEVTTPEKSDNLYANSGELAQKYQNDALVANLTKTATPIPVKIPPRYARMLIFPILNQSGDVYYDYNYAWVKIKDEEFVLGKREGKSSSNGHFTINKKVN